MMKNRKTEEGAVLLLLIIMMSAVVLIVASLLKFNTQNIKFAAIEMEQEQALYLAEGVADAIDLYLLETFHSDASIDDNDVNLALGKYTSSVDADYLKGFADLVFPNSDTLVGETSLVSGYVLIKNHDSGSGSFLPDPTTHEIELDITITGSSSSRTITATYKFPQTQPEMGYESFIVSKELNYSN